MGLLTRRVAASGFPARPLSDLDAGCCGMAGSFGYAREHYAVSKQIGERKLLPAARAMQPESILVASGVSCRQQVKHSPGVEAAHPAELLRFASEQHRALSSAPPVTALIYFTAG